MKINKIKINYTILNHLKWKNLILFIILKINYLYYFDNLK